MSSRSAAHWRGERVRLVGSRRSVPTRRRAPTPVRQGRTTATQSLALSRAVGNRAMTGLVRSGGSPGGQVGGRRTLVPGNRVPGRIAQNAGQHAIGERAAGLGEQHTADAHRDGAPEGAAETDEPQGLAVYRHASWEHVMLGNTDPARLGQAVVSGDEKVRRHLLEELRRQMLFFRDDPRADPRSSFPDLRWIQLRTSRLWVSYGELNALADYLPSRVDELEEAVVLPVLQRMRSGITKPALAELLPEDYKDLAIRTPFEGEARGGGLEYVHEVAATEKAMDNATASLGADRYLGLVARNACHFAPFSWHRWAHFHESAREHALAYHRRSTTTRPLKDLDAGADDDLRQAWLQNGYGDHFLQDSFAAGHLINKTLVMQWFVDYLNDMASKWWDLLLVPLLMDNTRPWYGMPSDEVMQSMGTAQQPGMAGRELYRPPTAGGPTAHEDWELGSGTTDPQTAQERRTPGQRIAGSGVQAGGGRSLEQNYQTYLDFLNSSFLQLAAGNTHDYLNERGLVVSNERGDVLHVGGDDTLLSKSGPLGAERAAEAAHLSQTAIDELASTGTTRITVASIMQLVPRYVWANIEGADTKLPLEQWHDEVLHEICVEHVFPDVVDSFKSKGIRAVAPEMVEGGLGTTGERPTPAPPVPPHGQMGDFPLPGPDDPILV